MEELPVALENGDAVGDGAFFDEDGVAGAMFHVWAGASVMFSVIIGDGIEVGPLSAM